MAPLNFKLCFDIQIFLGDRTCIRLRKAHHTSLSSLAGTHQSCRYTQYHKISHTKYHTQSVWLSQQHHHDRFHGHAQFILAVYVTDLNQHPTGRYFCCAGLVTAQEELMFPKQLASNEINFCYKMNIFLKLKRLRKNVKNFPLKSIAKYYILQFSLPFFIFSHI